MSATTVDPPAPQGAAARELYLRSYLLMRVLIGAFGIALPVALYLGDGDRAGWAPRRSLSAYYYSDARDLFVAILFVVGVFLITYKVFERTADNRRSTVAGLAALGVALLPTRPPAHLRGADPTLFQRELGEVPVMVAHYTCAVVFLGLLAVISYRFGTSEGARPRTGRVPPAVWRAVHRACSAAIVLGVATCVVGLPGVLGPYSTWLGEVVAVAGFGVSWFAKGARAELLLAPRVPVPAGQQ